MPHECMSPATHGGIGCSQCNRLWEEIKELHQRLRQMEGDEMSISVLELPLTRARNLANALAADLLAGCSRVTIAGSIRRRKPEVGDLELVAIPTPTADLFGDVTGHPLDNHLEPILQRLVDRGDLVRLKDGPKMKQFTLPAHGCNLDLFLTSAENFGLILLIRTSSADFSRRFVTQRFKGGLLPDDLRVEHGRLWRGDEALLTPEEADCFRLAGLKYLEPWERE